MQHNENGQLSAVLDEEKDDFASNKPLLRDDEKMADTESQVPGKTKEQDATRTRTIAYLGMYFMMNLSLTFYNKLVLGKVGGSGIFRLLDGG
jgi:hypothetical protein